MSSITPTLSESPKMPSSYKETKNRTNHLNPPTTGPQKVLYQSTLQNVLSKRNHFDANNQDRKSNVQEMENENQSQGDTLQQVTAERDLYEKKLKALSLVLASIETENSDLKNKVEGLEEQNAATSKQRDFYADVAVAMRKEGDKQVYACSKPEWQREKQSEIRIGVVGYEPESSTYELFESLMV
jgi:septal ring factor EnvC (AmiA/AmiB activator)